MIWIALLLFVATPFLFFVEKAFGVIATLVATALTIGSFITIGGKDGMPLILNPTK